MPPTGLVRLGDGTDESHLRMQGALDHLLPYMNECFAADRGARGRGAGVGVPDRRLARRMGRHGRRHARRSDAALPAPSAFLSTGKHGVHSSTWAICWPKCKASRAPIPARSGDRHESRPAAPRHPWDASSPFADLCADAHDTLLAEGPIASDDRRRRRTRARTGGRARSRNPRRVDPRPRHLRDLRLAPMASPRSRDHPDLLGLPGDVADRRRRWAALAAAGCAMARAPCWRPPGPPTGSPNRPRQAARLRHRPAQHCAAPAAPPPISRASAALVPRAAVAAAVHARAAAAPIRRSCRALRPPCKALYRCLDCREPFDYFKPY
jgi:hypothetical protein